MQARDFSEEGYLTKQILYKSENYITGYNLVLHRKWTPFKSADFVSAALADFPAQASF